MAALKSRWVRLIFFLGLALIAFFAAIVVATSEEKPSNVQMALIILGLLALFDPLKIAWDTFWAKEASPQLSNRQILINQVRRNWIEGVLNDALRDAEFDVPVKSTTGQPTLQPQPVEAPQGIFGFIKTVLLRGDTSTPIPNTPDSLAQTFAHADHKLLILGAPGGGKTVLLLQLAQRLLDEAETNERKSVPVVFNLSSWGAVGGSIKDWVIAELKRNYGASPQYAKELVNGDSLIYLLDGLDEVAEAYRDECVAQLNLFITPERQLVVCSRTEEYDDLAEKLSIPEAIEAQPLTETQFQIYLNQYIKSSTTVAKILTTLRQDDDVWQEANKPLFINILISTYRDGKPFRPENIHGDTRQRIQKLLIQPYVVRQLQNVPNAPIASENTRRYLAWISWWLIQQEQTVFYLESLQVDGLPRTRLYDLLSILFVALVTMLSGGLFVGPLGGLCIGLFVGPILGAVVGLRPINVEQKLIISLTRKILHHALIFVRVFVFVFVLFMIRGMDQAGSLFGGLVVGLFAMLFFGLVTQSTIAYRKHPGQGVEDTLRSGLFIGLFVGLFFGLIVVSVFGIFFGILAGLFFGLFDVYKHFLLRWFLHRQGDLPFRAVKFLNYARERRLLRQVGGGFIFIHRYLLDYFDDQYQSRYLNNR